MKWYPLHLIVTVSWTVRIATTVLAQIGNTPCHICFDDSTPRNRYRSFIYLGESGYWRILDVSFHVLTNSKILSFCALSNHSFYNQSDGSPYTCAMLDDYAAGGAYSSPEECAYLTTDFEEVCNCPIPDDTKSHCTLCPSTGVQNPYVVAFFNVFQLRNFVALDVSPDKIPSIVTLIAIISLICFLPLHFLQPNYSESIAFMNLSANCSDVAKRLSEKIVYTQDCASLQEMLNDICCAAPETTTAPTSSPTSSPTPYVNDTLYLPCSICFDGSTPLNRYDTVLRAELPHIFLV
jgi:hypothetical protein